MQRFESDDSQKQLNQLTEQGQSLNGAFEGNLEANENQYLSEKVGLEVRANKLRGESGAKDRMTTAISPTVAQYPGLPGADVIDYAGMEQDGYNLEPDEDGRITVPLNRAVEGQYIAGGVDLKTGKVFDSSFQGSQYSDPIMTPWEYAGALLSGDEKLDRRQLHGISQLTGLDIEIDPNAFVYLWQGATSGISDAVKDMLDTSVFLTGDNEAAGKFADYLRIPKPMDDQEMHPLANVMAGFAKIATMYRAAGAVVPGAKKTIAETPQAELARDAIMTFMWDPEEGNMVSLLRQFNMIDEEKWADLDPKKILEQGKTWGNEFKARLASAGIDALMVGAIAVTAQKFAKDVKNASDEVQVIADKIGVLDQQNVYEKGAQLEKKGMDRLKGSGGIRLNSGIDPTQVLGAAEATAGKIMQKVGKKDATHTALEEISEGYALTNRSRAQFKEAFGELYAERELDEVYNQAVHLRKTEQRANNIDPMTPQGVGVEIAEGVTGTDQLLATHTVSAMRLDGMMAYDAAPNLSIMVSKADDVEFPGQYGDVTFIGDKNLVTPGPGMDVFSADAATARQPFINQEGMFKTTTGEMLEATPENLSKHMPRGKMQEAPYLTGDPAVLKARMSEQFKSIEDMVKNKKSLGKEEASKLASMEEAGQTVNTVIKDLYPGKDQTAIWESALSGTLKQDYPDLARHEGLFNQLLTDVTGMKTQYFEAKSVTPVAHKDWQMAVVPDNLDAETVLKMESRGIYTVKYRAGDKADQAAKIKEHGGKFAFTTGGAAILAGGEDERTD